MVHVCLIMSIDKRLHPVVPKVPEKCRVGLCGLGCRCLVLGPIRQGKQNNSIPAFFLPSSHCTHPVRPALQCREHRITRQVCRCENIAPARHRYCKTPATKPSPTASHRIADSSTASLLTDTCLPIHNPTQPLKCPRPSPPRTSTPLSPSPRRFKTPRPPRWT